MNFTLEYRNLSGENIWIPYASSFIFIEHNTFEVNFSSNSSFESTFYDFRVIAEDLDNATSILYYNQSLKINNNLPEIHEIIPSEYVVNEESYLYLYGNYSDDVRVIQHDWSSSIQGIIGSEEQISINTLQPGIHQIIYQITDNEGGQTVSDIEIRINGLPRVDNLILSHEVILSYETLEAEYMANDDIGITDFEWLLDGKQIDSFDNENVYRYDIHKTGQENFLLGLDEVIEIQAQYDNFVGIRTNREEVLVGRFSSVDFVNDFSSGNSNIFLEYINLTWEDQEGSDDSCQWLFRIFENDMEIDSIQTSCLSDGDDINSDEYYIGREYSSNIQIEIWYEGWDDINLYLGENFSNIGIIDLGKIGKEFNFKLNNTEFINDANLDENVIHALSNYYDYANGDQNGPSTRTKGEFAYVGRWGGSPVETSGEYTIDNLTLAWVSAASEYDTQCTWKLKIFRNGQPFGEHIFDCKDSGWSFISESYQISETFYVNQGENIEYEIWFQSFEHLDIYADLSSISFICQSCISDAESDDFDYEYVDNRLVMKNLPEGKHELSIRVKDTDGVWSDKVFEEFLVNQPPSSIIDLVSTNVYHKENPRYVTLDLAGRGFDDVGVEKCEWQMEYLDNERFDLEVAKQTWQTTMPCSQYGVDNLTAGNYSISLRVEDTLGIWGEWFVYPDYYVDDGDNITFQTDVYPLDNTQWYDRDKDGCGDNEDGTNGDAFPNDPSECLDSDGDGVGDNSDFLPEIPNMYFYGATGVSMGLIGAALAELGARRSIPGLISALEQINSTGITDNQINQLIENLEEGGGLQFFSNDRADALKLINEYEGINSGATESFQGLGELKEQLAEMEASGISSPDLAANISELENMLENQVETDTNSDYLETLKEEMKNKGDN